MHTPRGGSNPTHSLALENSGDLRRFLGEAHPVVRSNSLSPPKRQPHPREHEIHPLPRLASLPSEGHALQWWRAPLAFAPARAAPPTANESALRLETVLAVRLARVHGRWYPGGRVDVQSPANSLPVLTLLRALHTPAARAGRSVATVPLDGVTGEFNDTLAALDVPLPAIASRHPTALQPTGRCRASLIAADQLRAFDRLIHRRSLVLSSSPGAGQYLHRDRLGTANWQLQLRGSKQWVLCPGGAHDAAPACAAPPGQGTDNSAARVSVFDPNYAACPTFRNASCLVASLQAGEAIYYPPPWWVQAQSATADAASLAVSVVTREHAPLIATRLKEACNLRLTVPWDDEWGVTDAAALCAAMTPCLDEWAAIPPPAPLDADGQRRALANWLAAQSKRVSAERDGSRH